MYHSITLCGRVGAEPESRTVKNNLLMVSFSMAIDIKGAAGKTTIWPKITVFGKTAEIVSQYVHKGSVVLVEGRLSPDATTGGPKVYQGKDGVFKASYDIVAEKVQLVQREEKPAVPTLAAEDDIIPF